MHGRNINSIALYAPQGTSQSNPKTQAKPFVFSSDREARALSRQVMARLGQTQTNTCLTVFVTFRYAAGILGSALGFELDHGIHSYDRSHLHSLRMNNPAQP